MSASNNSANSAPRNADALDGADRRTVSSQEPVAATPIGPRSLKDVVSGGDADFPEPTLLIEEGQVIASRFRIIKKLGEGGMGLVFQAHDPKLKRHVVLKFIKRELAAHEHMVERLLEEAAAAAALDHQHIVKIYDRDRDACGDFLVMQHINGPNLLELLAQEGGKLPIERAVRYALQVGSALQRAHEANILHRDVKPSNILIDEQHNAILADWGLARILDEAGQTRSGAVIGTLDYMAPEVVKKASNASPQSDLFSLAATLYQLATGKSPRFMRESLIPDPIRRAMTIALDDIPESRQSSISLFISDLNRSYLEASHSHVPSFPSSSSGSNEVIENRHDEVRSYSSISVTSASSAVGLRLVSPCETNKEAYRPGDRKVLTVNGVEYAFRWCPPGSFTMGSPKTEKWRGDDEDQVMAEFTAGFWMQETTVTQEMWSTLLASKPWLNKGFVNEGLRLPATYVDWPSTGEFISTFEATAKRAQVLPPSARVLLPSESRWEYACRAGTSTMFSYGNDWKKLGEYAWFEQNSWLVGQAHAHEVRLKRINPWGLHDMHGNVFEWCLDLKQKALCGGIDPLVTIGDSRIARGGSWNDGPRFARSSCRHSFSPLTRASFIGFRFVIESWNHLAQT